MRLRADVCAQAEAGSTGRQSGTAAVPDDDGLEWWRQAPPERHSLWSRADAVARRAAQVNKRNKIVQKP